MTETLYTRIGGAAALESVVHDFYDRVLTDPVVAPAFGGVNLTALRRHMVLYLAEAFGAPAEQPAVAWDLHAAHRHLGVTDAMFDAVVGHLSESLEARHVDPDLVDEVVVRLAAQREAVVTVRAADPVPTVPERGGPIP